MTFRLSDAVDQTPYGPFGTGDNDPLQDKNLDEVIDSNPAFKNYFEKRSDENGCTFAGYNLLKILIGIIILIVIIYLIYLLVRGSKAKKVKNASYDVPINVEMYK